jgi:hypothetical protein
VKKVLLAKGYEIDARPFFVNLIGVRNGHGKVNVFDDVMLTLIYKPNGLELNQYNITTDTGLYFLQNPMNPKGTAILKEGHYPKAYQIGKHKGHRALVQVGKLTVYRDNDKDDQIDIDVPTDEGSNFFVNIHGRYFDGKSVDTNPNIGRWSAGCQVFERNKDIEKVLDECTISLRIGNGNFNYTLLNSKDFEAL